ncbi:hypothetical protein AVEN_32737-1 [Araneus ventricosus]|uniref:Uncharacterized protein n=1 Tax=Araneus ventricosus TaxID=182803 RepID=A0A4Y2E656_ARAVE|nr:hypothetical protein AVEN_32737-1 [Araneus ventricosus]
MPACKFELSCRQVNMAGRIDASVKSNLRSFIRFHEAESWFVEKDQWSCFFSDFTMIAKSHSEFLSCLIHDKRPPSQFCDKPTASGAVSMGRV